LDSARRSVRLDTGGIVFGLTRRLARATLWSILDIRVDGADRLQTCAPAIVVANHPCALDGLLLLPLFRRQPIMLGLERHFRQPLAGWYLRQVGLLPVREGALRSDSMFAVERGLRAGRSALIFPEGQVSRGSPVDAFRGGFLVLAYRTGVPVIPVTIVGSEHALAEPRTPTAPHHFVPRRARVDIHVLSPVECTNPTGDRAVMTRDLIRIRERIVSRHTASGKMPGA
jgi:1-acyl-sn-glycerol-3-phosphate acyltransferase